MITVFVHIVFGVCLVLAASSPNGKQKAETKQEIVNSDYEDRIEPMFNQEDKDNGR